MPEIASCEPKTVDLLLVEQGERWRRGERVQVETLIQEHATLLNDTQGLLDLLFHEFTLREERGESPTVDEYLSRFPEVAAQFRVLVELHRGFPEDRLRREMETPLDAGARTTIAQPAAASGQIAIESGDVIAGKYKLVDEIGAGSMGTVWRADQTEPVKRRVALKLINADRGSSKAILARFEAERQAIAIMNHPNIAKLLEAGTTGGVRDGVSLGHPFFVMELVNGKPLTDYCDAYKLSIVERLKLFVEICSAVQHAHQKGIIHRDLKPSNILVENHYGAAVPKVIDFGLAKATSGLPLSAHTQPTAYGTVAGTPLYMAPEQADVNVVDIDTRADIYALGVILYELLTGSTPIALETAKKAALHEIMRIIRQDEPKKPSTRLSSDASLSSSASVRQSDPRRLTKTLRGDLDSIVMKALEKDRNRRYETANGFAADVLRYLHGETVLAHPPSAGYRLRKFFRKNRGPALAACAIFLALLAGVVGTTLGLIEARQQRQIALAEAEEKEKARRAEAARADGEHRANINAQNAQRIAEDEKKIAEDVRRFLLHGLLDQADVRTQANALLRAGELAAEAKKNPTIRELLDRAAQQLTPKRIKSYFPKQPRLQAEILQTVGNTYQGIGEHALAIEFLKRSAELRQQVLGAEHLATLAALYNLAVSYRSAGRLPEAIRLSEQVHTARATQLGADDPATLAALHSLALANQAAGKRREAIDLFKQVRDALAKKNPGADDPFTMTALNNLAVAYLTDGQVKEAIALFEQIRTPYEKQGVEHPDTLTMLINLATAYRTFGSFPKAIEVYKQVCPPLVKMSGADDSRTLAVHIDYALALQSDKQLQAAIDLFVHVLKTVEKTKPGVNHPLFLSVVINLVIAYHADRKHPEANGLFGQVLDNLKKKKFGLDDEVTLDKLSALGVIFWDARKYTETIQLYVELRPAFEKKWGANHDNTLILLNNLARSYQLAKMLTEAIPLFKQVHKARQTKDADALSTQVALAKLAGALRDAGQMLEAIELFARAATAVDKGKYMDPSAGQIFADTADCYERLKQWERAAPWWEKWLTVANERGGVDSMVYALGLARLGENLLQQKKWPDAEAILCENLSIRQQLQLNAWTTFNSESMLGAALLGQNKLDEAAKHLLSGYVGMKEREATIPAPTKDLRLREALERLVQVYEGLEKKGDANKWRAVLEALKKPEPK